MINFKTSIKTKLLQFVEFLIKKYKIKDNEILEKVKELKKD